MSKAKPKFFEDRKKLPIYQCRNQIVKLIAENQTTIIIGETGCGKSTQVPQYLIDSKEFRGSCIAVTQPRRVSATSLARRVAYERYSKVGGQVGYSVRFDNFSSKKTQIKYLTDGMLLREILADPNLSAYNVVILDEIHERTVQTDLLMGLLRKLQDQRSDLKIVLMSATLDCKLFIKFFNNPPIIHVHGRVHPVLIFYTDVPQSDYIEACDTAIEQLNDKLEMPGDFLVFMTGQEEIEELASLLRTKQLKIPIQVMTLYAALDMNQQQLVFEKAPEGTRKIILSTNIAETSVTIPGIKYVIDSGLMKMKTFNPVSGVEVLGTSAIAKAQAMQRSGRAGREFPGACFRLYTEQSYSEMIDAPIAEIRRADLSSVVLQLMALGIENPVTFDFLEPPPKAMLYSSIEQLYGLEAIDDAGQLTEEGQIMAQFPLIPKMSKVLILASQQGCGSMALTLLAMLSCENLFISPEESRKKADHQHKLFLVHNSDHLTLINIYEQYINTKENDRKEWCYRMFLSERALKYAVDVRAQLEAIAKSVNFNLDEDPDDKQKHERLLKCLVDALPDNTARHVVSGKFQSDNQPEIYIHPSSLVFNEKANIGAIVFSERVLTKRVYARWVSAIDPSFIQ